MRFIHTADWHIGKLVHGIHMTEDQKYILDQFIEMVKEEKPDAIVIAGDLYDRSIPPVEAVQLLGEALVEILLKQGVKVIAIAGNHDSPDRIDFGGRLMEATGLYISGKLKKEIGKVTMEDEFGPVNFYTVPYAEPVLVRELYGDETIKTHDDAFKVIIDKIKATINMNERNVLVAHGYITSGESPETCDSERPLSIGGTDAVNVEHFHDFNYVALGHLHGAQKINVDKIRYSGSLMKYSFSEVKHKKSVTIVDIDESGDIQYRYRELAPKRNMRKIRGELKDLIEEANSLEKTSEDYIMATLTDKGEIIDAIGKLRNVYPNVLRLEREASTGDAGEERTSASKNFVEKSLLGLFTEFYENITGNKFNQEMKEIVVDTAEGMEKERRNER
ncbi:exonuclease SbcCD subunit D [Clostridium sediminicola]|uniref:exonuclease SbcCD subunit D n=1 Tax=Clostridium sediminicola TaxID=3114879 RepID=UPI0031F24525